MSLSALNQRSTLFDMLLYPEPVSVTQYHKYTNEDGYVLEIPMVGLSKENVKIDIEQDNLIVTTKVEPKSQYVRNYSHTWTLPKDSNIEGVTATMDNGLLIVRVPRVKPVKKTVSVAVV